MNILSTEKLVFNNTIRYPDISIEKGNITFISGESGCGKSSLLKLFNRTYTASSGKVFFNGKNTADADIITLRKDILLVSQNVYLFNDTIKGNFDKFYVFRDAECISEKEIQKYLDICCVPFSLGSDCLTMSGGEKQRVYMAIFLSFMPQVLMLDEPTSALDEANSNNVIANITDFCKQNSITLIIVSHDTKLTEKYSENTIVLKKEEV